MSRDIFKAHTSSQVQAVNNYIQLLFYRHNTDVLASGLLNKEYDFIFTWDSTDIRQEEHLEFRVVEHVPLFLALYRSHPLAQHTVLKREDLKGENETEEILAAWRSDDSSPALQHFVDHLGI